MIRQILALGGISIAMTLAQTPAPKPATAKQAPAKYTPPKTPWGEPDLQGIWPLNHLIAVPLQRPTQYGNKAFLTDEEVSKAQAALDARNKRFQGGPVPVADTSSRVMRQTSLIVDP